MALTIEQGKCDAQPVALDQNGHRYVGHWHGNIAVFGDGEAFRTGHGWLGASEARDMIPRICQGHTRGALRVSDYGSCRSCLPFEERTDRCHVLPEIYRAVDGFCHAAWVAQNGTHHGCAKLGSHTEQCRCSCGQEPRAA